MTWRSGALVALTLTGCGGPTVVPTPADPAQSAQRTVARSRRESTLTAPPVVCASGAPDQWPPAVTFRCAALAGSPGSGLAADEAELAGPASVVRADALEMYRQERYSDAAVQFDRVINDRVNEPLAARQQAQFHMGKALFHLQRFERSLQTFVAIAEYGPGHLYFQKTVQWLANLDHRSPGSEERVIAAMQHYPIDALAEFNAPATHSTFARLVYLTARARLQQGCVEDCFALLPYIEAASPDCALAMELDRSVRNGYFGSTRPPPVSAQPTMADPAAPQR